MPVREMSELHVTTSGEILPFAVGAAHGVSSGNPCETSDLQLDF